MDRKTNNYSSTLAGEKLKRTQPCIRDREHQLRVLTDHSPGHIAYVDATNLCYQFVNQKFENSFGRPREEIIGKHIKEIIGESNYEFALKYIAEVRAGKSTSYVNVFNLAEGQRWIKVNYSPDLDERGEVKGIIVLSYDITELKQAEENVRNSERRFADIINFLPDATFVIDRERKVVTWNHAIEKLTGVKAQHIVGKGNYEYAIPFYGRRRPTLIDLIFDWNDEIANTYQYVKKEGDTLVSETRDPPFKPESSLFWNSARPLYDAQGEVIGAIEVIRDITERMRSEEALQKSERLYRGLFENTGTATFVIEDDFTISQANAKCEELSGYSREEIEGRMKTTDFVAPEDLEQAINYHFARRELVNKTPSEYEFNARNRQGDVKTVFIQLGIIPETKQSIASIIDITPRKKAEEALQESQEKYRLLFENANDAIFIAQDGVIKFPNPKVLDLVGFSAEELAQMPFTNLVHPADRAIVRERYQKRIAGTREIPATYSHRVIHKTGDELLVDLSSVRITWEGRPATLNFLRDITQQKKIEAQLQQAQRMESIGTLAGGIAHDFNNLLMGIQGNASLLMSDIDNNHPHYERLNNIEQYVKNGSELTRQLLGFARGGKYEVRPSNLNPIIDTSIEIFGRTKKEIRIHKKYQKQIWAVDLDRGQIEQVLLNLYVNAWQAMPAGGDLFLQTENVILEKDYVNPYDVKPGSFVKISITDTGIGMDAATQQRIFDPFFTTKEKDRGTGLGLASAYGIINNHDGIICVYSEKGKGTTFNIFLPATEKIVSQQQGKHKEPTRGYEVLLLVDDEEMILEIGKAMLEKLGYQVITARGGKKALEIYKNDQNKIDMVILDMIMPDMSGRETYNQLKKINPSVKTLLSSGYSINGKTQAILNSGCSGFIQKPFNLTYLSQKIREILGQK
jgi:two-component system, cell cycle sensor histidine kinase and response regulator CckA